MAALVKVISASLWATLLVSLTSAVWPAFPSQSGIASAPLGASVNSYPEAGSRNSRSNSRASKSESDGGSCTCWNELNLLSERTRENSDRLDGIADELAGIYSAINTLKNTANSLQAAGGARVSSQAYNVAFSARVGYNKPYLGETEVIVFDELVINNGDVYDPYSGKFTSPVPGLYKFESTILSGYNVTIETMLVMNGNEVARMFSSGFNTRGSGSNAVLLNMNQGDQVWVSVFYGNGDYVHGQWSTFSGHLVYAYAV